MKLDGLIERWIKDLDPYNPIPIVKGIPPGNAWASFNYDDKTRKEQRYIVNDKREYAGNDPDLVALDVAVHEIRHRVQLRNKKLQLFPELKDPMTVGMIERLQESAKINDRQKDAVVFSIVAKFLWRNGISKLKIKKLVILDAAKIKRFAEKVY